MCDIDFNVILFFRFKRTSYCGVVHYSIVGYLSLYNFYAYPDKIRPRIRYTLVYVCCVVVNGIVLFSFSQVLILPPFQRKGLGGKLIVFAYSVSVSAILFVVPSFIRYLGMGDISIP